MKTADTGDSIYLETVSMSVVIDMPTGRHQSTFLTVFHENTKYAGLTDARRARIIILYLEQTLCNNVSNIVSASPRIRPELCVLYYTEHILLLRHSLSYLQPSDEESDAVGSLNQHEFRVHQCQALFREPRIF